MLKPISLAIGAAVVVAALVIAASIWPRGSIVATPSAGATAFPSDSPSAASTPGSEAVAGGPSPDLIHHSWQRPLPVTPGMDRWGSGFLSLANGRLDYGREPGTAASRAEVTVADLDTLVVTATVETRECAIGDVGEYRWSVEGKDTVMTLTAIRPDACATRETAIAGTWVRSDLPVAGGGEATLLPGAYLTSVFDPFAQPGISGQLSYTVPEGWTSVEDAVSVTLTYPPGPLTNPTTTDLFITLLGQPVEAAAFEDGAPCAEIPGEAPGVGHHVDDIVVAIMARDGVISMPPEAVTIGGYEGRMLDLSIAPSWTGGCQAPEGAVVGIPLLRLAGSATGPMFGVAPDHPLRLILLDLTGGRTTAIAIFGVGPTPLSPFHLLVAAAMPIVESFQFHPPAR